MANRTRIWLVMGIYLIVSTGVTHSQDEQLSSQAWYVLRQRNVGPLLLGLTQRLGKVIESSERTDPIWTGKEQDGSLKLDIIAEGDLTGEIFIGFFKDPNWSNKPVQVRSFPGSGKYVIENLPVGEYQIGAMIGRAPVAIALGVQKTWPKSVEISSGTMTTAQVLVSEDFQRFTSGWYNKSVSGDFIGDWKNMNPDNLLQGQLTGPGGRPIAFAEIMIREHNPGARGIRAPNRGTNEQGYYKYDGINWPYKVIVVWKDLMPSVLGYRYQQMYLNSVLEGPQTVDFKFEDFPIGTATLTGKVSDQNGDPLREFFIAARTQFDSTEKLKDPDGKYYNVVGYRKPFISEDGSFKLDNLPSGDFSVRVIPFNIQAYEFNRGDEVVLQSSQTTNLDLKVIAKNIFYGRVLFRDGRPAVIKPSPWSGARTSILMPIGGRARRVAEVDDDGYFDVKLSDREIEQLRSGASRLIINVPVSEEARSKTMGDFSFERLAKEKSKAGIIEIARPERTPKPLVNNSLPTFEGIEIGFDAEQVKNKTLLICFFDMNQRPSRNCIMRLAKQAQQLKQKGVTVVAVQASKIDENTLNEWVKKNNISFPVGMVQGNVEKSRFSWGVKSLPWLILTDNEHLVVSEGFRLRDLDNQLKQGNQE